MTIARHLLAGTVAALLATAAIAQTPCPTPAVGGRCGFTIGATTPVAIMMAGARRYSLVANGGSSTLWCTFDDAATPSVAGPSSIPIGGYPNSYTQEYPIAGSAFVPPWTERCICASGTCTGSVVTN